MNNKLTILFFIGMIAACIISWRSWMLNAIQVSNQKLASDLPDAYMENVVSLIFNKQGNLKMKIESPKVFHFTKNDSARLFMPRVTLYRDSPQPWYITSRFAKTIDGIESVDFWQNVLIHHPDDEENPETNIKSQFLRVHPKNQTAETKSSITLTQPNLKIRSTGMRANMNTGEISLLSKTEGEYAPASSS